MSGHDKWQVWLIDLSGESEPELAYEDSRYGSAAAFARQWLEDPLGLVPAIVRGEETVTPK